MSKQPTVESRLNPPVSAYPTLKNFLLDYKQSGPPTRLDTLALKNLSGTVRAQLFQTLRFFGLINEQNYSQDSLTQLVKLEGEERAEFLRDMLQKSYPFIFNAKGFDLTRASETEIRERFESVGLSGDLLRKAKAFFLNACADAGITVSQFIVQPKKRSVSKSSGKGGPTAKRNSSEKNARQQADEVRGANNEQPKQFVEIMRDLMTLASNANQWSDEEKTMFMKMAEFLVNGTRK